MSLGSIGAYSNWWQSQNQATTGSSAATTTSSNSSITNTGSLAATSNMSTFMQSFSADLQSMLTQLGNATGGSATSSATNTSSGSSNVDQTGTVQAQGAEHHHHHHHYAGGAGEDGSPQNAANQLVGEIGQSLQGGTLSATQIGQSANAFAVDVMQALQSYGTTASSTSGSSIVA